MSERDQIRIEVRQNETWPVWVRRTAFVIKWIFLLAFVVVAVWVLVAVFGGIGTAFSDARRSAENSPPQLPPASPYIPPRPPGPPADRQVAQSTPELPRMGLYISYRRAIQDDSYVLVVENKDQVQLKNFRIDVEGPSGKRMSWQMLDMWPNLARYEYGWAEGWRFLPGDKITITADGRRTYTTVLQRESN